MAEKFGLIKGLVELLFPPRCTACERLLSPAERECGPLCNACMHEWKSAREILCERCFLTASACRCQPELLERVSCGSFYKLVYYMHGKETPVQNKMIYRIKNTRDRRATEFLARELASILEEVSPDTTVLTYIPRRRSAYRQNGTDQARELARELSRQLQIPLFHVFKRKKGKEREQKLLSPEARWRNARASYALRDHSVAGRHVLLVDDIVTTGATLAACVNKLLRAGALSVCCVAVAADDVNRTPMVAPLVKGKDFAHFR